MLPLHIDDAEYKYSRKLRIKEAIQGWLRLILSDKTSRNIFLFLLLNLTFAFVELFYGVWTNSLGLISDSFHMFFDCTALLAGLIATLVTKWKSNASYSYGFVRAEILAGFMNGLFLIFVAFFIFKESIERLVEPPEVKHERLLVISILGFLVNLVGIFSLHHGHSHGGSSHSHGESNHGHSNNHSHQDHNHSHNGIGDHGHAHNNEFSAPSSAQKQIMQGVFLHILADTLGSVGVIISSILMSMFGWMIADPICSLFISVMITISTIPLLRSSIGILMQRTPMEIEHLLPECFLKVKQIPGVYGVQEPHFWTLCSENFVGTLKIEVAPQVDTKYIISHTQSIFSQIGVRNLYIQIDNAYS